MPFLPNWLQQLAAECPEEDRRQLEDKLMKKTKHTFYQQQQSGDIATLSDWRADFESMDVESWSGKTSEEFDPAEWIAEGGLEEIELTSDDNRVGHAHNTWTCHATDKDGERYIIYWVFPGEEQDWGDESFINSIEVYYWDDEYCINSIEAD